MPETGALKPGEVAQVVPPTVPCPKCYAPVTVVDDYCYRCEVIFVGGELWGIYEAQEAIRVHYR